MALIIRDMGHQDMAGKAYVHWQSWREAYAGLLDESYLARRTLARCEEMARRWTDNTLVAELDGRIVGFGAWGVCRDEILSLCGELHALYVLKECYGQGIGYSLMNACMQRLSKYPAVILWVLDGNTRAIRFYERYGFAFDGAQQQITLGTPKTERRMIYHRNTAEQFI